MNIIKKLAVASAAAAVLLPGSAHAIWYGSKASYEKLDDCLKANNKCYWGAALVESSGAMAPIVSRPDYDVRGFEAASATRPPPFGRPLPTDGDVLFYTTKKPDPSATDPNIYRHMCLLGASVTPSPCGGGKKDIWIKS